MGESPAASVLKKELNAVIELISEISKSLKQANEKRKSFEYALDILEASPPPRKSRNRGPSLAECTVRILQERGALFIDAIVNQLVESGREVEKPSVTTALSRLKRNAVVRKGNDDRWYLTEGNDIGNPKSDIG